MNKLSIIPTIPTTIVLSVLRYKNPSITPQTTGYVYTPRTASNGADIVSIGCAKKSVSPSSYGSGSFAPSS